MIYFNFLSSRFPRQACLDLQISCSAPVFVILMVYFNGGRMTDCPTQPWKNACHVMSIDQKRNCVEIFEKCRFVSKFSTNLDSGRNLRKSRFWSKFSKKYRFCSKFSKMYSKQCAWIKLMWTVWVQFAYLMKYCIKFFSNPRLRAISCVARVLGILFTRSLPHDSNLANNILHVFVIVTFCFCSDFKVTNLLLSLTALLSWYVQNYDLNSCLLFK